MKLLITLTLAVILPLVAGPATNPTPSGATLAADGTGLVNPANWRNLLAAEPALGLPATTGYFLSSTSAGVRSWAQVSAASISGLGTLATQSGTFSGVSSGTNTGDQTNISGNAATATKLAAARTIAGQSFDGSANISITAANVGAVGNTGNETVAGSKTLSGQLQLTGQSVVDANSAITKSLLENYVLRDSAMVRAELGLGTARTVNGGTVSSFFGAIALTIPTTVGAEAYVGGWPAIMCGVSPVGFWNRRIICGFSISPGILPANRIILAQLGKDRADVSHAVLNNSEKGIGFIISPTGVTAYATNASVVSSIVTGINPLIYGRLVIDFTPGVGILIYGVSLSSPTPVLLGMLTSNLPSGNDNTANGCQIQVGLFDNDVSTGSAPYTAFVSNVSISFP